MASNKGRAYFALVGYHFNPADITRILEIEPTSTNDAGARSDLDNPVISSWEFSTDTINADEQELDVFKLIDDEILKKIEPAKDKIIEVCKDLNLSPRIGVVLNLSVDKDDTTPDVGFGARTIRFLADIGAFINVEYELSERI